MKRLVVRLASAAPVGAQLAGGGLAASGLYLLAGLAWSLLAAGVAVAAVGTLAEFAKGVR